jgi:anti-sigma regulatory factor (Ser/Thr protein kinase)
MKPTTPPDRHIQKCTGPAHEFAMRFTSTPRGARLARRLVSLRLDEWGHPYDSHLNETATLIAAELAANAVRHGHVQGRDFHLRLSEAAGEVRLEVSDTRTERLPEPRPPRDPAADESGRGLLLVGALTLTIQNKLARGRGAAQALRAGS